MTEPFLCGLKSNLCCSHQVDEVFHHDSLPVVINIIIQRVWFLDYETVSAENCPRPQHPPLLLAPPLRLTHSRCNRLNADVDVIVFNSSARALERDRWRDSLLLTYYLTRLRTNIKQA